MRQALWGQVPSPPAPARHDVLGEWQLSVLADLCTVRHRLRELLPGTEWRGPAYEEDVERMLLTVEELASNGLRHGRSPVRLRVLGLTDGWLVDVTDTAPDRPPVPAVDRDPARGGLGLHMVADLCSAHGWAAHRGHKHVWAWLRHNPS